jgi:hypothetical protein
MLPLLVYYHQRAAGANSRRSETDPDTGRSSAVLARSNGPDHCKRLLLYLRKHGMITVG